MTQKPAGSGATLDDATSATPRFIADKQGDYVITLVVTDEQGAESAPDSATVSFTNVKPVANAGGNQSVRVGHLVEQDGSNSSDANLDPLTYQWSFGSIPAGSTVVLNTLDQPKTSFTPDRPGPYVVRLIVNDGFVDSDPHEVTVTAISSYPLTLTKSGSGTVASTDGGSICTQDYDQGTSVALTATPASGYGFAGWGGACTGSGTCTVTMDAAKSVTATFALNTYPITVSISPANAGTATCAPNPVDHGGNATCVASANAGYAFTGWSGDCTDTSCQLTGVTGPKSVNANFVPLTLAIGDVRQAEGDSGNTAFRFTVSLSAPSTVSVTVNYATANGTATTKGKDYNPASGVLTFVPGQTSQTLIVDVKGDTVPEADETFYVNLTSPTGGATLTDAQGVGTLLNDDRPTLKINDVSKREGRSGTTAFVFTVSLSAASTGAVSVDYVTANGTATAGSDYTTASGTLSFNPGEKSSAFTVNVRGDTTPEPTETFSVNLANPVGATLADAQGIGTIVNDD
jgi:hypothetical protein